MSDNFRENSKLFNTNDVATYTDASVSVSGSIQYHTKIATQFELRRYFKNFESIYQAGVLCNSRKVFYHPTLQFSPQHLVCIRRDSPH